MRRFEVLAGLICAGGIVLHQAVRADWFIDDAAIGFAFARNLAEGHGLVPWPGGERVEAFSHPTWIVVLAIAHALGADGFTVAKPLAMVCGALQVPFLVDLARRSLPDHRGVGPWIAPFLLAVSGPFAMGAASGLENAWFALLLTGSVHRAVVEATEGGPPWSGVGFLLVAWTRPEGLLYGIVGGLWAIRDAFRTRNAAHAVGFWSLLVLPSLVLEAGRLAYFGLPLPNSYYAKRPDAWAWLDPYGRGWTQLGSYASRSWQGFALPVFAVGVVGTRGKRPRVVLAAVAVAMLLIASTNPARLARSAWWPTFPTVPEDLAAVRVIAIGAGLALLPLAALQRPGEVTRTRVVSMVVASLAFWVGSNGDWMGGFRFASYTAPLACVTLAVGITELADAVQRVRRPEPMGWTVEATWVAALLAGLAVPPGLALTRDHVTANFDVTTQMMAKRVAHVRDVRARLRWKGRVVVADMDIGGWLWYAPEVEVVDLVGLIDPEMARRRREGIAFVRPYVLERRRPDLVHLHGPDWWWSKRTGLLDHPQWSERYVQLQPYPDVPGVPHDPHPGLWIRRNHLFGPDPDPGFAWNLAAGWTLEAMPQLAHSEGTVAIALPLRRSLGAPPLRLTVWRDGVVFGSWSSDGALLEPARWPSDVVSKTHVWREAQRGIPEEGGHLGIAVNGGAVRWFDTTLARQRHDGP